jgi:mono/diheme cytochrome c family protein
VIVLWLIVAGTAAYVLIRFRNAGPWIVPDAAKLLPNPVPVTSSSLTAARSLFLDNCAHCHGDRGHGDGPDAALYKPRPASLVQALRAPSITDGEIFWKITAGRRLMPGFKNQLSDEQRWQLVNLLRTFPESPG